MEICYLPIESLRVDLDNLFAPLSEWEYEDLRDSIAQYGIQEPLIATAEEDGFYTVISGNNRLRVAREIGIKTLPCSIIDKMLLEAAMDTEIFRRHLSLQERKRFKALKEEKFKEKMERIMEKKLIPELFDRYKRGLLNRESAIGAMKLNIKEQTALVQSLEAVEDAPQASSEEGEVVKLQEEIAHLKELISKKNQEIREMKEWKEENRERLEEKLAELEKEKNKANKVVKKEFEVEIKNLMETNEKLVSQIKEKQAEIEKVEEEKEKFQRLLSNKEVEIKAEKVLFAEAERKYMVNIIIFRLDAVLEEIIKVRNCLEHNLSKKDARIAREKIRAIIESSEELLALIKED
jgi:ParB family chromosome partitioning protein